MADVEIELARDACGVYSADTFVARRLRDGSVVIEVIAKDAKTNEEKRLHWTVVASSKLGVSSKMWGSVPMVGVETDLWLDGKRIVDFEFDFVSGGTHDEDVAKMAVKIAEATRCALDIQPLAISDERLLASIRCGDDEREQLYALQGETGIVRIDNVWTCSRWRLSQDDTLVVAGDESRTTLDRRTTEGKSERIARFVCRPELVLEFVDRVATAAACKVDQSFQTMR